MKEDEFLLLVLLKDILPAKYLSPPSNKNVKGTWQSGEEKQQSSVDLHPMQKEKQYSQRLKRIDLVCESLELQDDVAHQWAACLPVVAER